MKDKLFERVRALPTKGGVYLLETERPTDSEGRESDAEAYNMLSLSEYFSYQMDSRSNTMETETMGRVVTEATIENLQDLWDVQRGLLAADKVRRVVVSDALADTGATMLALPSRLIRQLGLTKTGTRRITSSQGEGQADVYEAVRLTIHDRNCPLDVMEVPDKVPVLIGQIPLERLDFVVDPQSRSLIGNPAHGGEHIIEAY
jgi:predicted aspartyl protease